MLKKNKSLRSQKAQVFYTDFMVGLLIFAVALLIYIAYVSNYSVKNDGNFNEIVTSISTVSSSLVSAGVPSNWNLNNVESIGLTNNDHRIDADKLENFQDMNYNTSKKLLSTKFDYVMFLEDNSGVVLSINGKCSIGRQELIADYFGNCSAPNMSLVAASNIVSDTRLLIYESKITRLKIYQWDSS